MKILCAVRVFIVACYIANLVLSIPSIQPISNRTTTTIRKPQFLIPIGNDQSLDNQSNATMDIRPSIETDSFDWQEEKSIFLSILSIGLVVICCFTLITVAFIGIKNHMKLQ